MTQKSSIRNHNIILKRSLCLILVLCTLTFRLVAQENDKEEETTSEKVKEVDPEKIADKNFLRNLGIAITAILQKTGIFKGLSGMSQQVVDEDIQVKLYVQTFIEGSEDKLLSVLEKYADQEENYDGAYIKFKAGYVQQSDNTFKVQFDIQISDNLKATLSDDYLNVVAENIMPPNMAKDGYSNIIDSSDDLAKAIQQGYLALLDKSGKLKLIEITDSEETFAAGIDNDELNLSYTVRQKELFDLKYIKLEVFQEGATEPCYRISNTDGSPEGAQLTMEKANAIGWDGKMNLGERKGEYIRFDESPFDVVITISSSESFIDTFSNSVKTSVDYEVDEWNENKDMHGWVACEKCTEKQRYEVYKGLVEAYEYYFEQLGVSDFENPLEYYKNNLSFDDGANAYTFLGKAIRVHKNFYPVLKDIEKNIVKIYGMQSYQSILDKYRNRTIGGFAIRYVNNGEGKSKKISPHGLGLAIDVDSKRNPQMYPYQLRAVFFLIKRVTSIDFSGKVDHPIKAIKSAQNKFIDTFKGYSIENLSNSFEMIQNYHESENVYSINKLSSNVISEDFDKLRQTVVRMTDLISSNSNIETIKVIFETINLHIDLIEYRINLVEQVINNMFNLIIYTKEGKESSAYFTDIYIPTLKTKLMALKNVMRGFNQELLKQTPNLSSVDFTIFLEANFKLDLNLFSSFENEYSSFNTELSNMKLTYSDLRNFANALEKQIQKLKADFGNILLLDGFCDMSEALLAAILSENIKNQHIWWGGYWDSKKDFMHFGVKPSKIHYYIKDE